MLERDLGERLRLALHRRPLLRLQGLVQAVRVAPVRHQPAGELVHDHDPTLLDDVVPLSLEQVERAQSGLQVVEGVAVLRSEQVL